MSDLILNVGEKQAEEALFGGRSLWRRLRGRTVRHGLEEEELNMGIVDLLQNMKSK